MVDMMMDCAEAEEGWFEFKGFLTNDASGWEADVTQVTMCVLEVVCHIMSHPMHFLVKLII